MWDFDEFFMFHVFFLNKRLDGGAVGVVLIQPSADINTPHDRKKYRSSTKFEKDGCWKMHTNKHMIDAQVWGTNSVFCATKIFFNF
jgi:hypothetical protein